MGSAVVNKHDKGARIIGKTLLSGDDRRDDAVRELIDLCADEIAKGLNEH
jgi:hypothetical protein